MKTCSTCKLEQSKTNFTKKLRNIDGLCTQCKSCVAIYVKKNKDRVKPREAQYRKDNKDRINKWHRDNYAENKEKIIAKNLKWNSDNIEKVTEYRKKYFAENKEKISQVTKMYRVNNPEKRKATCLKWDVANAGVKRVHAQNRRNRKLGGTLSKGLADKLFKLQNGKCPCCNISLGTDYHMDHIMPLALGGSNTDNNIQLLRKICNLQKGKMHPIDFMQSRGF